MTVIVVTGAQGFIGRHLCAHLLDSQPGATVVGIGRSELQPDCYKHLSPSYTDNCPPAFGQMPPHLSSRFAYERVDLLDTSGLERTLRYWQPTAIFHLAAKHPFDDAQSIVQANITGSVSLLKSLAAVKSLSRLLFVSSGAVYGVLDEKQLPAREESPCEPIDLYGASKLAAERIVRIMAMQADLPVTIARIFNVLGPGQGETHVAGRIAAQICSGKLTIHVRPDLTTRDFIDVRDAARALVLVARDGAPGAIYNIASGKETPVSSLLECMIRVSGFPGNVLNAANGADRPGIIRQVADISRLLALGFKHAFCLERSIRDQLLALQAKWPAAGAMEAKLSWAPPRTS